MALLIESSRIYGRGVLRGIAKYAHAHGPWSFFVIERELHSGIPELLKTWKVDGILARIEDRRMAKNLSKLGCPIVDVLGQVEVKAIPGFDTDSTAVARIAADFFSQAGFQHFAFSGYPGIPFSDRRKAAFVKCLADRGLAVRLMPSLTDLERAAPSALIHLEGAAPSALMHLEGDAPSAPPSSPKRSTSPPISTNIQAAENQGLTAPDAIAQWLKKQPRPLAVFACNDVRAQQILNACRENGIKVPEEIAVMGVDNDDVLCNLCDPPLSSIEPDTEQLGYAAAAALDSMMRAAQPTGLTLIPPVRLVERASTDVVAIDDPITVAAVRYIRDNVGAGIAVKDVAAHLNRSRSDLDKRFRIWLKSSVRTEILRRRLDRVCQLLKGTDLTLDAIAMKAGFQTAAHLCRLFHRRFRQTPTQFRHAHSQFRQ